MKTSYLVKLLIGTFLFFTILFISAGTIYYWQGCVYFGIGLIMFALNSTVLQADADLLKERSKAGEGAKKWDKTILGLSFLVTVAMFIVAGLDSGRYHWSADFHWSLYAIGIILTVLGQLLFLIAQKQNRFFSSTVRIQTNRNHTVCDTGLYSIVRHPGYMGSVIQSLGFPLLFGSLWSMIPVSLSIVLLITRTCLEDRTLKNELREYVEYSERTKYKMIPFAW
jgi:protein-S-isoprenylcysteine O-methyltransferase Ste14